MSQAILISANFCPLKILKTFFRQRNTRQTIDIWFGLALLSAVWRDGTTAALNCCTFVKNISGFHAFLVLLE
jgi:hypothetical protein